MVFKSMNFLGALHFTLLLAVTLRAGQSVGLRGTPTIIDSHDNYSGIISPKFYFPILA